MILICLLTVQGSFYLRDGEWRPLSWDPPINYEADDLWMVVFRTWEKHYASNFRYLMICGDGTDDCNVPMHWRSDIRFFQTRDVALEWINLQFAKERDRFVSLRRCGKPERLVEESKEHHKVESWKTTEWKMWGWNKTD